MENENILRRYTKPSKIGLKKFGETSYLNAFLQMLGNIPELIEYFLNVGNQSNIEGNIKKMPLSFVIERFFRHIYPFPETNENIIYGNEKILSVLGCYNYTFNSINKRNIKDLVNFILEKLHEELNSKKITNLMYEITYDQFNFKDSIDKQNIIFSNSNKSIISDLFNIFEVKEYHCSFCEKTKYDLLQFNTFDLDIFSCSNNIKSNNISLSDCLNYFLSPKDRDIFCPNCQRINKTNVISRIYNCPNVLIFLLRENIEEQSSLLKFKIEKKINLKGYIQDQNTSGDLELIGIISIFGTIYVSFCKSPIDNKWYIYKDEEVNLIEIDEVVINNNNLNVYIPCILCYKLIKNNN